MRDTRSIVRRVGVLLLSLGLLTACGDTPPADEATLTERIPPAGQPTVQAPPTDEKVLRGMFVGSSSAHPIHAWGDQHQRYFRPDGSIESTAWIAVVPDALVDQVQHDVPVEIHGRVSTIEPKGPPGTKQSYTNTKVIVSAIRLR